MHGTGSPAKLVGLFLRQIVADLDKKDSGSLYDLKVPHSLFSLFYYSRSFCK